MTMLIERNTTYAALSQLKSADLNEVQDAIADLHCGPWVRHTYYPTVGTAVADATETTIADGLSAYEDGVDPEVAAQGAGAGGINEPFPTFVLQLLNPAVSEGCRLYTGKGTDNHIIAGLDDRVFVAEWSAQLAGSGGTVIGANEIDIYMGLHEDPDAVGDTNFDDGTAHAFVMFRKLSADTNWQCMTADGTAADAPADSGVPPTATVTWQTFRIEYHGVNTPVGVANTSATARFYINGTLVATVTGAEIPVTADVSGLGLSFQAYATATGPDNDLSLILSPIAVAWNIRPL